MYRNALDPYGLSYEPNLGWDSPEVTSTANALFAAQPSRFPRWELNALAGGEQAKAGLFGKALGALGLDESGNRAATSWIDAAKHTAGNVINAPQDIANQLLALREYQPVYGTAGDAEDRALAGRQAAETFGLAGLAPVAAAGVTRATRAPGMPQKFEPGWHPDVYYHGTTKDFERFASPEELAKRDPVWRDPSMSHQKHHFTVWPDAASQYAMENGVDGARVIPVRLRSDVPTTQMGAWAATDTPGTVKSAITGETLFSNPKEASLPGLLMDQESRLARAREMGFDTDTTWYHGTNQPLEEITPGMRDPGAWFTTDMTNASNYARGKDAQLYYTRLRAKNPLVVESMSPDQFIPGVAGKPLDIDNNVGIVNYAFRNGHDAVHFPDGNFSESGNTMVVRNGNQIRDTDAAFDPAQSHSANLLASNPKEASLPALMSQSREGQGDIADIIRKYGWAAAAPLIAAYQTDGAQANALAGR